MRPFWVTRRPTPASLHSVPDSDTSVRDSRWQVVQCLAWSRFSATGSSSQGLPLGRRDEHCSFRMVRCVREGTSQCVYTSFLTLSSLLRMPVPPYRHTASLHLTSRTVTSAKLTKTHFTSYNYPKSPVARPSNAKSGWRSDRCPKGHLPPHRSMVDGNYSAICEQPPTIYQPVVSLRSLHQLLGNASVDDCQHSSIPGCFEQRFHQINKQAPRCHIGFEMASRQREMPPAYAEASYGGRNPSAHEISEAFSQKVLSRREPDTAKAQATERLRRFLSFCLAVDYDRVAASPDQLTRNDWCHFVQLGRRCLAAWQRKHVFSSSPPHHLEDALGDPRIECSVIQPAKALGVPIHAAVAMSHMFVQSISRMRPNNDSAFRILPGHGTRAIAAKLLLDRDLLFDTVLPKHHLRLRTLIDVRWTRLQRRWFVRLDSPDDYQSNFKGQIADHEVIGKSPWPTRFLDPIIEPQLLKPRYWRAGIFASLLSRYGKDGSGTLRERGFLRRWVVAM